MKIQKALVFFALVLSGLGLKANIENGESENKSVQEITRTKESSSVIAVKLAQAIYRTEYEAREYQVEVPYDETETYQEYDRVEKWECVPDNTPAGCTYQTVVTYEWVTKTRTITKYRTETRVDYIPYDVFDHWWKQTAELQFPVGTELFEGEKEVIKVTLAGTEKKPKITISQANPIFKFEIKSQKVSGELIKAELTYKPFVTPKVAGKDSVGKAKLEFFEKHIEVVIPDKITNPRVASKYLVKVFQKADGALVGQADVVTRLDANMRAKIEGTFDAETDYKVEISVARSGIVMTEPVQFALSQEVKAESLSLSDLKSAEKIRGFAIKGLTDKTQFSFKDRSEDYVTVRTQYGVQLALKKGNEWAIISEKVYDRNQLTNKDKEGAFVLSLKNDMGVSEDHLKLLIKGETIRSTIVVRRTSKRIGEIKIDKKEDLKLTK